MEVKTEGTVQLSIAELDNLRGQIKDLTKERDDLKLHAEEVKLNITVEEEYTTTRSVPDYDTHNRMMQGRKYDGRYDRYSWSMPQKLELVKDKHIIDQKVSYISLEDTISQIRKEEEYKVIQKLGELDRQILGLKEREEQLKTAQTKELTRVRESWEHQIEETAKTHKQELDAKQAEIDRLNGVVSDQTKDQEIATLKQQLEELKLKKSFWSFIHS